MMASFHMVSSEDLRRSRRGQPAGPRSPLLARRTAHTGRLRAADSGLRVLIPSFRARGDHSLVVTYETRYAWVRSGGECLSIRVVAPHHTVMDQPPDP